MSDFKEIVIKNVEFIYPKLDKLYRYDPHIKRDDGQMGASIPATKDEPQAKWEIGFIMEKAAATEFWNECKAHFEARDKVNKFGTIHSYRQREDDRIQFNAKRNAKTSKGEYTKEPAVVDGAKQHLADRAFYSGSTGNIKVSILPTKNPSKKGQTDEWGITVYIGTVQVLNALYGGGDDLSGLDDDGTAAFVDPMAIDDSVDGPFGLPSAPPAPANLDNINDDIPF